MELSRIAVLATTMAFLTKKYAVQLSVFASFKFVVCSSALGINRIVLTFTFCQVFIVKASWHFENAVWFSDGTQN